MRSPFVLGAVAGLGSAAVSIFGNLRRGDPHLVSVAPDIVSLIAVALVVYAAVRASVRRGKAGSEPAAGRRTILVAASTCAGALAVFTWQYFPGDSAILAFAMALGSFIYVALVGAVASLVARRSRHVATS